jgi:four helix bundle protein
VSKLGIGEQEWDESLLWLEVLVESGIVPAKKMDLLRSETEELLKIVVTSLKTLKRQR